MVIPVGAILHGFTKLIHPAYGHASQGGDWRWALRRARWQDRGCNACCDFQNSGPWTPETFKTQSPDRAHFTYINVPAPQEKLTCRCSPAGCVHASSERGGGAPAMVRVCHGPLGWGQRSRLSSFRTTLVERYLDPYLVCYLYSLITMYLSSPSALPSPPFYPPPHCWTHPS